jgi:hypothetical protein
LARLKLAALTIAVCGIGIGHAGADPSMRLPPSGFTTTLSNHTPLIFGMDPATAANALQAPLTYVSGRPGNEIFMALRTNGSLFFEHRDRLYLQFRNDRLSGWKGDWGHNWMWR